MKAQHVTVFLFIASLLVLFSSCGINSEEAKLIVSRANVQIEKGKNVEIVYSGNGLARIRAKGKTVTRYNTEKPYLEFSNGFTLLFYDATGEVDSKLTSKYATAVENSRTMFARDSVVVVNRKGERLDTDELVWDEENQTIYSNSFVKITTDDEVIYGKGMQANQNFTNYTIKSISGKIKVNSPETAD